MGPSPVTPEIFQRELDYAREMLQRCADLGLMARVQMQIGVQCADCDKGITMMPAEPPRRAEDGWQRFTRGKDGKWRCGQHASGH